MNSLICIFFWIFLGVNGRFLSRKERECRESEILENGSYRKVPSILYDDERVYTCDKNHVSNIPGLSNVKFICRFNRKTVIYEWGATSSKFDRAGPIFLNNVTCEVKKECYDPPIPEHMTREVIDRYQVAVAHNMVRELPKAFYTSDTLKYSCQSGYEQASEETSLYGNYGDYNYNYDGYAVYDDPYNYGSDESGESDKTVSEEIACDNAGRWNGQEWSDLHFGECKVVHCDATRFSDMRNGNITDYKEDYGFLEEMKLVCEDGYRPKEGVKSAVCMSFSSFGELSLPKFGCEPIQCMEPASPKNGLLRLPGGLYVGEKAVYECFSGYKMKGKAEWTCQGNGEWDSQCVICDDQESYCSQPCIPLGAEITSIEETYSYGTVLEFTCKEGYHFGGSLNRTCMLNKQWSGTPIDCTGASMFEDDVGLQLIDALKHIPDNGTNESTNDTDEQISKTINKGAVGGVDVYLLVDISKSITDEKFNATKRFLSALIPELGVNNGDRGTRLALAYFASKTYTAFNQHMMGFEDESIFKSGEEAQTEVMGSASNLKDIRKETDFGTAISRALDNITTDVSTKKVMFQNGHPNARTAQQVLIIISDGQFTTMGDPTPYADYLKDILDVEIYSVAIGNPTAHRFGFKVMNNLASVIPGERHFFQINGDDAKLEVVLKQMINSENYDLSCGVTKPHLTNMANDTARYEEDANAHAWPWMAQIRTKNSHICGGSLIGDRWILTAAHCFDKSVSQVHLRKRELNQFGGYSEYQFDRNKAVFKHEKYDEGKDPKNLYDIALIQLPTKVIPTPEVLPVCIWNNEIKNETNEEYTTLFTAGDYGVVTGWGQRSINKQGDFADILKQMQMDVQSDDTCVKELDEDELKSVDLNLMFCAGGKETIDGVEKIIDACRGDSGGPFVVRHPLNEKRFIQIGIVSFGFGCKGDGKYGFYTKLTEELIGWINDTINREENNK